MAKSGLKLGNTLSIGNCGHNRANFRRNLESCIGFEAPGYGSLALAAWGEGGVFRIAGSGKAGHWTFAAQRVGAVARRREVASRNRWEQAAGVYEALFFAGVSVSDRQAGPDGAAGRNVFENRVGERGGSGGNRHQDRGMEPRGLERGAGSVRSRLQGGSRSVGIVGEGHPNFCQRA